MPKKKLSIEKVRFLVYFSCLERNPNKSDIMNSFEKILFSFFSFAMWFESLQCIFIISEYSGLPLEIYAVLEKNVLLHISFNKKFCLWVLVRDARHF